MTRPTQDIWTNLADYAPPWLEWCALAVIAAAVAGLAAWVWLCWRAKDVPAPPLFPERVVRVEDAEVEQHQ